MEQRVRVGDELQLAVQVRQAAARQGHAHFTVAFDLHAVHLRRHVQRPQGGGDVYLWKRGGGISGMTAASQGNVLVYARSTALSDRCGAVPGLRGGNI